MVLTWLHHPIPNSHIKVLSVRYLYLTAYVLFSTCPLFVYLLELEDYDKRCRCNNQILLNTLPVGTQLLKPIAASESCNRQEVLAILKDKGTKCLNPNAQAVRRHINRLFFRLILDEEQRIYDVVSTNIEFGAWPAPTAYKAFLWKYAKKLNYHHFRLRW
ncbi:chemokine vCXCL2 [Human betaherpesvirus 5]|uniref:Chemokine vCXCL2 n=1 Tax=Human cytomegalovirus TaxID=10359 RepID=Q6SWX3_HCMV|nr:chemokine vCXCL2 [Human betaherpesvirus 5]ATP76464.1 chemokine vCXCL2 [synthetic human betaherpesvirus 5]ABV71645.1 UL147 [Human betaherpesvirus 5]AGQ47340.1 chemokine vCXCL2 [Human betaherpesvirus 5]APA46134.1 UL147 [Human betaherpesvirus 5]